MLQLAAALSILALTLGAAPAAASLGDCGQPLSNGATPVASDCLFILRAAVELETCEPLCMCDTNGDAETTATDALICLNAAVRQIQVIDCICEGSTTPSSSTSTTASESSTTTNPSSTSTTTGSGSTTTNPTPTSTTSNSSSTTTTHTTTTTTAAIVECSVHFRVESEQVVGGLVYEVAYASSGSAFVGAADQVDCTAITAEGAFQFNDDEARKVLVTAFSNATGLTAPAELAECTVVTAKPDLDPADFQVVVTDAIDTALQDIEASVAISSIQCAN